MQLTGIERRQPEQPGEAGTPWRQVAWRAVAVLVLFALVKPVVAGAALAAGVDLARQVSLVLTLGVSLAWIIVMTASATSQVMATLVVAGVVQALAAAVIAFMAGLVVDGVPSSPWVSPVELVEGLGAGALWGVVCAACAMAARNAREQARERRGEPARSTE